MFRKPAALPLEPGDRAPEFSLPDHTGTIRNLSDHRGRVVVLWFYPKARTPGWTIEGRGFRALAGEFEKENAQILGVSFDSVKANAAFVAKERFPFPLLSDATREMALAYGAADTPAARSARRISYVIDENGTIAAAYPAVSPASHAREVMDFLASRRA
jgi:thioredoxin-dependent peroxiredoxin